MNRIHGRFEISNEDFVYVLSSFVFEPIRWNARFGWRPADRDGEAGDLRVLARGRPAHGDQGHSGDVRRARAAERGATSGGTFGAPRPRSVSAGRRGTCSSPGSRVCRIGSARRRSTRSWTTRCSTHSGSRARLARSASSCGDGAPHTWESRGLPAAAPPSAPPHEAEDTDVRTRLAARDARTRARSARRIRLTRGCFPG